MPEKKNEEEGNGPLSAIGRLTTGLG